MEIFHFILIFLPVHCTFFNGKLTEFQKMELCATLDCDDSFEQPVCGVRYEDGNPNYKLFNNECKLLEYGCQVESNETYGIINMEHCDGTTSGSKDDNFSPDCDEASEVCGIRPDGEGFRVRIFQNECQLNRHNHDTGLQFTVTDFFICSHDPKVEDSDKDGLVVEETSPQYKDSMLEEEFPVTQKQNDTKNVVKSTNLVIVDGSMLHPGNINESIRHFFASTHFLDLPMREIEMFNESTRRRLVKKFGPLKLFTPSVDIPKNISEDYFHQPTLRSCYHKCPTKCPDTYAPVCGDSDIESRAPRLMFRNHCFMDVAQCKMFWEAKARGTISKSAYIESSFFFCLGEQLNSMHRFVPIIRTLQRMGRLKIKGHYRYKMRNMRFYNDLVNYQPKIMG